MNISYVENKRFQGIVIDRNDLVSEYEKCEFIACNFSGIDLSNIKFIHCQFVDCNLSMALLKNTTLEKAHFVSTKLLGVNFSECNAFNLSLSFEECTLNDSSFYGCKLSKTTFTHCRICHVDFENADFSKSKFVDCLLTGSNFFNTNLQAADLYTAQEFYIDLDHNKVKGTIFSLEGLPGLLEKYKLKIKN